MCSSGGLFMKEKTVTRVYNNKEDEYIISDISTHKCSM